MNYISTAGLLAFLARAPALSKLEQIKLNQTIVNEIILARWHPGLPEVAGAAV
jgi:hypothetical protein